MFQQKENRSNFLSSSIVIVLFFLFVCAFSRSSESSVSNVVTYELLSKVQSNHVALDNAQHYSIPKISVQFVTKLNYKHFSPDFKITADNFLFNQKFTFLKHSNLQIKPTIQIRFYHCYYTDSEVFPIFS